MHTDIRYTVHSGLEGRCGENIKGTKISDPGDCLDWGLDKRLNNIYQVSSCSSVYLILDLNKKKFN